jgi:hypothetical protein
MPFESPLDDFIHELMSLESRVQDNCTLLCWVFQHVSSRLTIDTAKSNFLKYVHQDVDYQSSSLFLDRSKGRIIFLAFSKACIASRSLAFSLGN